MKKYSYQNVLLHFLAKSISSIHVLFCLLIFFALEVVVVAFARLLVQKEQATYKNPLLQANKNKILNK